MKNLSKKITKIFAFAAFLFVVNGCNFLSNDAELKSSSSIVINLPYGNNSSREATTSESYTFQIDCYSGSAISGTPLYSTEATSGQTVTFDDVEPGTYTVNVKAWETSNPGIIIYQGQDTQTVSAGSATSFAIKMTEFLENYCWIGISQEESEYESGEMLYKPCVQLKDGVSVTKHYWYYDGIDITSLLTSDTLNFYELGQNSTETLTQTEQELLNGQLYSTVTLVTKFSDGTYDSFILNNFVETYAQNLINEKINALVLSGASETTINSEDISNEVLKEYKFSKTAGSNVKRYLKITDSDTSNFLYNFTFVPASGMTLPAKAKIEIFDATDTGLESVKKTVETTKDAASSAASVNYNFATNLDAGYYLVRITIPGITYQDPSMNYIYSFQDLVRVDESYKTVATLTEDLENVYEEDTEESVIEDGSETGSGGSGSARSETVSFTITPYIPEGAEISTNQYYSMKWYVRDISGTSEEQTEIKDVIKFNPNSSTPQFVVQDCPTSTLFGDTATNILLIGVIPDTTGNPLYYEYTNMMCDSLKSNYDLALYTEDGGDSDSGTGGSETGSGESGSGTDSSDTTGGRGGTISDGESGTEGSGGDSGSGSSSSSTNTTQERSINTDLGDLGTGTIGDFTGGGTGGITSDYISFTVKSDYEGNDTTGVMSFYLLNNADLAYVALNQEFNVSSLYSGIPTFNSTDSSYSFTCSEETIFGNGYIEKYLVGVIFADGTTTPIYIGVARLDKNDMDESYILKSDSSGSSDGIVFEDGDLVQVTGGQVSVSVGEEGGPFYYASSESLVTVDSFYIGVTEVTYAQWYEVYSWAQTIIEYEINVYNFANVGQEGSSGIPGATPTENSSQPVCNISWRDAVVWCNAASKYEGLTPVYYEEGTTDFTEDKIFTYSQSGTSSSTNGAESAVINPNADGYRLPTEAEWEFAARGGNPDADQWSYEYSGSSTSTDVAVFNTENTANVKSKSPNGLGLYDMSGNVREWCQEEKADSVTSSNRILKGGSYYKTDDSTISYRNADYPYAADSNTGFRVVKNILSSSN